MAIKPNMHTFILFRLLLTLYLVAVASAPHAAKWTAMRFEVSNPDTSTQGTSVTLKALGSISADTRFITKNREAIEDDTMNTSFTPAPFHDTEGAEQTIQSLPLNLVRIPFFDKTLVKNKEEFQWISDDQFTPNWDTFPQTINNTIGFRTFLFRSQVLRSLRDKGHIAYQHGGFSLPGQSSSPANTTTAPDDQKLPLQDMRLCVVTEGIVDLAMATPQADLRKALLSHALIQQYNLRTNIIIDDLLGAYVDNINILLSYKDEDHAALGEQTPLKPAYRKQKKYTFLGFEYKYTPPLSEEATNPKKMEVKWDIHEQRLKCLVPDPMLQHATVNAQKGYQKHGVLLVPPIPPQNTLLLTQMGATSSHSPSDTLFSPRPQRTKFHRSKCSSNLAGPYSQTTGLPTPILPPTEDVQYQREKHNFVTYRQTFNLFQKQKL